MPLVVQLDGEVYHDGQLPAAEFYRRLEAARRAPSTAAPAPGEFLEAFRQAEEGGASAVLCITLSAEYSGTYGAAVNAAEMASTALPGVRVQVLDTGGLAMAHGFAVLEAARATQAGATLEEAKEIARAVAGRAEMAGVLDTMRYLAKSGRVPWVVGWAAALLRIKPVLAFDGGKARSIGRVRTSAKGMDELLRYVRRKAGNAEGMHIAIMHAGLPGQAREFADRVRESFRPKELVVAEFTAVMGVHTGPGFLGVAFYSDEGIPLRTPPTKRRHWLLDRDVRVLEDALGPLPKPVAKPAVVVLSGLPGAGKSHLARELIKRYRFAHLESDRVRQALFERPSYTQAENLRLFNAYHEVLDRLLARGIPVLCDATNLREAYRLPLYQIAEKRGACLVVVQVEAPLDVVRRRLENRVETEAPGDASEAGVEVYERLRVDAEPVEREHIVVDTSKDISAAVERILAEASLA